MTATGGEAIVCRRLTRRYTAEGSEVLALDHVDLTVPAGTSLAVLGASGSGKSTLLTLLAGLQRPSDGTIHIGDTELTALSERDLLRARATRVAVTPQNPDRNLLLYATALDNVRFAQRGPRSHGKSELPDPRALLEEVGLGLVAGTRSDRLSGGERQRLAIATALASSPGVLLADEPTSQLDRESRRAIGHLLAEAARARGLTVVVVTHDHELAGQLDRTASMDSGRLGPATHRSPR